jgi:hypothetical protein
MKPSMAFSTISLDGDTSGTSTDFLASNASKSTSPNPSIRLGKTSIEHLLRCSYKIQMHLSFFSNHNLLLVRFTQYNQMKVLIQGITDVLGLNFEGFLPEPSGSAKN